MLCIAILHSCPSSHRGILIWLSFTRGPTVYVGAPQEWMFPSIDTDIIQQIIIVIEEYFSKQLTCLPMPDPFINWFHPQMFTAIFGCIIY